MSVNLVSLLNTVREQTESPFKPAESQPAGKGFLDLLDKALAASETNKPNASQISSESYKPITAQSQEAQQQSPSSQTGSTSASVQPGFDSTSDEKTLENEKASKTADQAKKQEMLSFERAVSQALAAKQAEAAAHQDGMARAHDAAKTGSLGLLHGEAAKNKNAQDPSAKNQQKLHGSESGLEAAIAAKKAGKSGPELSVPTDALQAKAGLDRIGLEGIGIPSAPSTAKRMAQDGSYASAGTNVVGRSPIDLQKDKSTGQFPLEFKNNLMAVGSPVRQKLDERIEAQISKAQDLVKNLANQLGLGSSSEVQAGELAQRSTGAGFFQKSSMSTSVATIRLVSDSMQTSGARHADSGSGSVRSADNAVARLKSRLEQIRDDRLGRDDRSRIQRDSQVFTLTMTDLRGQVSKPADVLAASQAQAALAATSASASYAVQQSGVSSLAGTADAQRRDSPSLVQTAWYAPAGERSITGQVRVIETSSQTAQQSLKDWLLGRGSKEIADQARIIMDGNDRGEIKLILKPENLGEVRISMLLEDGRIAGTISVDNQEVQKAFESGLGELKQALSDGGLLPGDFVVSVHDQGQNGQGGRDPRQGFAQEQEESRKASLVETESLKRASNEFERSTLGAYPATSGTKLDLVV